MTMLEAFIRDLETGAEQIGTLTLDRKRDLLHRAAAALRSDDMALPAGRKFGAIPWKLMQVRKMCLDASDELVAISLRRAAACLRGQRP